MAEIAIALFLGAWISLASLIAWHRLNRDLKEYLSKDRNKE